MICKLLILGDYIWMSSDRQFSANFRGKNRIMPSPRSQRLCKHFTDALLQNERRLSILRRWLRYEPVLEMQAFTVKCCIPF